MVQELWQEQLSALPEQLELGFSCSAFDKVGTWELTASPWSLGACPQLAWISDQRESVEVDWKVKEQRMSELVIFIKRDKWRFVLFADTQI